MRHISLSVSIILCMLIVSNAYINTPKCSILRKNRREMMKFTNEHNEVVNLMQKWKSIARFSLISAALIFTSSLNPAIAEDAVSNSIINLDVSPRVITDTCWLDIEIESETPKKERLEVGLYGKDMPKTTENFIQLSKNSKGYGYKGADVFRVIPGFSVQLGNIQENPGKSETPANLRSREGKAALNDGSTSASFAPESFALGHKLRGGGVVSMMTDIKKKGAVDSRFFIQIADDASWADNKYPAFGQITKGMTFVTNELQILETKPPSNYPINRVRVSDSGCYDAPKPAPILSD